MSDTELAKKILELIGGESNIDYVTHCVTRLRVNITDKSKIENTKIKSLSGVLGTNMVGDQYQVILGDRVTNIYNAFVSMVHISNESDGNTKKEKEGIISRLLDILSGIFVPIIPAIIGAGLLKGILIFLNFYHLVSPATSTYKLLSVFSDSAFYFMPILLAYSSAKKFKVNKYVAVAIAGILVHPELISMMSKSASVKFFGIPFVSATYSTSVLPIILGVWVMSYIERGLNKVIPKILRTVLVPLFTLLITAPIILGILGPIGTIVGNAIGQGTVHLYLRFGVLTGIIIGAVYPFLVILGMHVGFAPVMIQSLSKYGVDYIMGLSVASNSAEAGATTAVWLKTKNKQLKEIAGTSALNAIIGVTEPALFGVTSKLKKPLIAVSIGGAIGGATAGFFRVTSHGVGTGPIAGIPLFFGKTFIWFVVSCLISYVVSFVLAYVIGFEDIPNPEDERKKNTIDENKKIVTNVVANQTVDAPVSGNVIPLEKVKDNVFSSKVMGDGVAIVPKSDKVYAPFDGIVELVFGTKHAIGLRSYDGCELLIHVGIDTVELKGKHFVSHVEQGQNVKKNELLLEFDKDAIEKDGYDTTIPVIVTNLKEFTEIIQTKQTSLKHGDELLELKVKNEEKNNK